MNKRKNHKVLLFVYDFVVLFTVEYFFLYRYLVLKAHIYSLNIAIIMGVIFAVCLYLMRFLFRTYNQIWRYGDVKCYLKLIVADSLSVCLSFIIEKIALNEYLALVVLSTTMSFDLLIALSMRIIYMYLFRGIHRKTKYNELFRKILFVFSLGENYSKNEYIDNSISVAIVGAGDLGVSLAEELNKINSKMVAAFYIDNDSQKIGREINGIPVFDEGQVTKELFIDNEVQEVIFAIPNMDIEKRQKLYTQYRQFGLSIKVYETPTVESIDKKKYLREYSIDELLFRKPISVVDDGTYEYFKNKKVLITGGGGSIGSEMCRQVARMSPEKIILLDVCENGVFDVRTEMNFLYGESLDLGIEIANICNKKSIEKILDKYNPDVIIHAAAHKHVPLMEHNCIESIENNVFGTLNVVEAATSRNIPRFIMVSTDKAVNPVNVMGATKRVCEMIVKAYSGTETKTLLSSTRFGNVLNSAGSVVPIFKKQIEKGGPLTITDFRIIRYFMTIPEASQLVLKTCNMAKNGELFVLDMGKPVKILDLAENMIKLSGLTPYKDIDIVETGLRPGEKLFEELLVKTENLDKTKDEKIFIERDASIGMKELEGKLNILRDAINSQDDNEAKKALKEVVPTFKDPETVNKEAGKCIEELSKD